MDSGLAAARFALPLLVIAFLFAALAIVGVFGYRSITVSRFFDLRQVDVRGTSRTSPEDIRRTVAGSLEKSGVWSADLGDIKAKVEKFPFVKNAS